ncbi:general secretion pathway protein GspK [Rhodopseudomonas palustris]|uniref:general secretion pathway protein GspK n=1 Tax=Rhodopseudomonas palustris TaxID=1076 RepID=UPI0039F51233
MASAYVAQSATALAAFDAAIQSQMAASAGIELTAYRLSGPATANRPTHGGFNFRLGNCNTTVEFMSEAARINLNMAPRAMIAGLFRALGAQTGAADQFADRVVAWRSAPKPNAPDPEERLYRAAGLNYGPRRAPFDSVDELWLVLGLPPAIVERALAFVTVFSGLAEVNVLDAAPEVVAALPGMTPGRLDAFLSQRELLPPDPAVILGALGGRQPGATVSGSEAYRVRMRIGFADGRQRTPEAVIMILEAGEREAYRVLAWRDELEPGMAAQRPEQSR